MIVVGPSTHFRVSSWLGLKNVCASGMCLFLQSDTINGSILH